MQQPKDEEALYSMYRLRSRLGAPLRAAQRLLPHATTANPRPPLTMYCYLPVGYEEPRRKIPAASG